MASAGHVTFNSNAVLPVSESGVKICYFVQREHIEVTSAGHVTFNSNAVLPVSDSGVKYGILFSGNISRWLLLVMCPLTAMQSYLF